MGDEGFYALLFVHHPGDTRSLGILVDSIL